ncbi:myb-like protein V isoform X2 [Calliphora vicina]|uniref:myb-like protein V isoform X2 n=1 Tax=Calliphora vicina TaxID=7373 RepID=UPI00325AAD08
MAHETKQASGKEKHHGHGEDEIAVADDDEIEEIDIAQQKTFSDRITQAMEKFASNRMGQWMIERTDRVLKVLEDTAKWSLPQDDTELQLERPLPWIFFLTLIVWLRVFRIWLSVGSYIVGSQPVTPHTMVYYMQTKRRRLRAIRVQGLKSIRYREIETTVMHSSSNNVTFMGKLRKLFSSAICKPGQHREVPARRVFVQDGKGAKDSSERSTKRPRDDDAADLNLTVDEMLEKYANEDSDNDSDYVPKEDEDDDDSSTTSISSCTSDEETERKNQEKSSETQKDSTTSQNDEKPMAPKKDETKENGGVKNRQNPKDLDDNKTESHSPADSDDEEMHTPKETANTNGSSEERDTTETSAATTEVAPTQTSLNTPKTTQTHLTAPQMQENKQKSTPGHESAASLKPSLPIASKAVPFNPPRVRVEDKSYRTITTQTAIELDWTITIKTEITHTKHYPKLEKLDCSVTLTPASSTEDIFYSPIAQTSTPKEADQHVSPSSETHDTLGAGNQKKQLNHTAQNKQNNHHNHAKNRNKNRR